MNLEEMDTFEISVALAADVPDDAINQHIASLLVTDNTDNTVMDDPAVALPPKKKNKKAGKASKTSTSTKSHTPSSIP